MQEGQLVAGRTSFSPCIDRVSNLPQRAERFKNPPPDKHRYPYPSHSEEPPLWVGHGRANRSAILRAHGSQCSEPMPLRSMRMLTCWWQSSLAHSRNLLSPPSSKNPLGQAVSGTALSVISCPLGVGEGGDSTTFRRLPSIRLCRSSRADCTPWRLR